MVPGGPLPAIALRALTKRFGPVTAVDGLDLTIEPGEIVAFLGPNGAGKTTTIDMVLGLSRPDAGTVEVYGRSPRSAVAHGLVSAVMQTGGLLKELTVQETLELTAALFAHTRPVAEVLDRAGHRRDRRPAGRQVLRGPAAAAPVRDGAAARAGAAILDEPTTGMDVEGRREFWAAIRADAARGRTVLFATHYLEEADAYADRVVLVSRGRVVADGTSRRSRRCPPAAGERDWRRRYRRRRGSVPPGVEDVELRGDTVLVRAADSDAVARHLLTATPARDLQITSRGLEDAFLALTERQLDVRPDDHRRHARAPGPAARRLLADVPAPGDPAAAAQPADRRLHADHPAAVLLGVRHGHTGEAAGRGNVTAYIMISLAVYGAMIATTPGVPRSASSGPSAGRASSG